MKLYRFALRWVEVMRNSALRCLFSGLFSAAATWLLASGGFRWFLRLEGYGQRNEQILDREAMGLARADGQAADVYVSSFLTQRVEVFSWIILGRSLLRGAFFARVRLGFPFPKRRSDFASKILGSGEGFAKTQAVEPVLEFLQLGEISLNLLAQLRSEIAAFQCSG